MIDRPLALLSLSLWLIVANAATAQSRPATPVDSARQELSLIRRADAARSRGVGPAGALDSLRPTIHEFVDHACPTCRSFVLGQGDSLAALAATWRANLVVRVSPIPGLLRGAHAAEAAFCAGGLGGATVFDHVHKQLLRDQEQWRHLANPTDSLVAIAVRAGVDSIAVMRCLRHGTTRPLVLSDARLATQLHVDGTPTVLVVRPGPLAPPVRVVGELSTPRIRAAVEGASTPGTALPSAVSVLGRWYVDSLAIDHWAPVLHAAADSIRHATAIDIRRTVENIRAGRTRIETEFDASLKYTHRVRTDTLITYEERGAWAVPGTSGFLHVMRDDGRDGTNHGTRIVAGDARILVLEKEFRGGALHGLTERVYLVRAASVR
ncbi:DsbA family protein [Gemmatimonas sp.]|uniref:DsbA family protein n=1 Tax=Gemmatimonas sp. TaxID=1962908 RepID=UPI00391F79A5